MEIEKSCICSYLSENCECINIKNKFNGLDQYVIAWVKCKNILNDVKVNVIWSDPEGMDIVSVEIEVKKTTDTEKYRIIWSNLHLSIVNILKHSFGKWKVRLLENSKIIKVLEFEIKDINSVHEQIKGNSINLSI